MAKTNAEKQRDMRKRLADQGLTEVRNIFAKPCHHDLIKAYAKALAAGEVEAPLAKPVLAKMKGKSSKE